MELQIFPRAFFAVDRVTVEFIIMDTGLLVAHSLFFYNTRIWRYMNNAWGSGQ